MLLEGTALQRRPQLSVVVHTQQVQKGFSRFLYTRITTIYWTIGMLLSFDYYVLLLLAASFRWRPSFVIYWYWCCYLMLPLHNWTIFTFPLLPPILALLAAYSHKYQTQISLFFARPDKSFYSSPDDKNCILFCRSSTTLTIMYVVDVRLKVSFLLALNKGSGCLVWTSSSISKFLTYHKQRMWPEKVDTKHLCHIQRTISFWKWAQSSALIMK